jgi:hypothetical protein
MPSAPNAAMAQSPPGKGSSIAAKTVKASKSCNINDSFKIRTNEAMRLLKTRGLLTQSRQVIENKAHS